MGRQQSLSKRRDDRRNCNVQTETRIANGLGWLSIGLGLAEIAAPRTMANLLGLPNGGRTRAVLRLYGMREVAAGVGILTQENPAPWLWSRVGGDVLDLSSLGKAMASDDTERGRVGAAAAAVVGITALDVYCAKRLSVASQENASSGPDTHLDAKHIGSSVIIEKSPEEIYQFWRNFENLPRVSRQIESIHVTGPTTSHWKVRSPLGGAVLEWDADMTEDRPNALISWRSTSSSAPHSGSIRFERATGGRGTKVTAHIDFGDGMLTKVGKLLGKVPREQANVTLHNLKQLLETGEVLHSEASIHPGMHPGVPPEKYQPGSNALSAAVGK